MKILIADDHALIVAAVQAKLAQLDEDVEFRCAGRLDELFAAAGEAPDLALVDLAMPGARDCEHIARLRERHPALPLIVLSGSDDPSLIRALLDLGVRGYLPKAYNAEILLSAVRLVLVGGTYIPPIVLGLPGFSGPLERAAFPHDAADALELLQRQLTERQVEVLRLLSQGKPNKLIARELGICEGTVKIHLTAVFRVLKVHNRTAAVVMANSLDGLYGDSARDAAAARRHSGR
ncbi:LuxR C-terminal-related transcriptional regulator [Azotobacter beijerinckii]|uniref:Two component transcriptional regulator, LuxR family n=1 Tax=Azotobacter beijerinckii TaxID=170623 RepID=A0A1I4CUH8_9GAMM|nr:response regulator transcription factor [Azotobacter beijerinckii]SFB24964.1 two component transcriptional regulator, LuxR family [Azotobacter beijerinckii]SFK83571.1 two component transcriptional regulator, LuxR family [Azotobacter beijerinckii]